jgi:acylphosphatase
LVPLMNARLTVLVSGRVQGVGFRYWVRRRAAPLRLAGSATNLADGRVQVVVEGPRDACETLLDALRGDDTPGFVRDVLLSWSDPIGEPDGFRLG